MDKVSPTTKPSPEKKDYDPDTVIDLVLRHGCADYLSIGLELGFSDAEITAVAAGQATHKEKLQALIERKAAGIGRRATANKLLEVSRKVPDPFYGKIIDALEPGK